MRRYACLLCCFVALTLLACGRPQPPIKVGFAGNLTGRASDTGVDARNGALLAVEEINAAGGIKGRKIELLIKDDEGKPEVARKVTSELIQDNVVAIVGHVVSAMTQAALPAANEKRTLMLSPTSVSNIFTGKDDYLIRISPSAKFATGNFARFARNRLKIQKMAAIYDLSNKGYSEDWYVSFRDALEVSGGKLPAALTYTSGSEVDFGNLARQLLAGQPDGIVLITGAIDAALLCQQLRKLDSQIPILIAGWGMTNDLLTNGGKAVEGVYLSYNFDRNSKLPAYVAFKENFLRRFGTAPNFTAKFSYETVQVLREAIEKTPSLDGDALKKTIIDQGKFAGLQGDFKIDAFGDADAQVFYFTVKDGNFVQVPQQP